MGLKQTIFSGVRWSGVSKTIMAGGQLLLLVVLLRFLSFEDFAILAIAQLITGLVFPILEAFIGYNILHLEKDHSGSIYSAFSMLSTLAGLAIALILLPLPELVEWYYQIPDLAHYLYWMLPLVVAFSIGMPFRALQQRKLLFATIASFQMISFLVYAGVTLWLAFEGWGALALIWGFGIRILVENLLFLGWGLRHVSLFPKESFALLKQVLWPGSFFATERLVDALSSQLDTLLIGKLLGPQALGLYDLVKRFLNKPAHFLSEAIEVVLLPVFLQTNDEQQRTNLYQQLMQFLNYTLIPLFIFAFAAAAPITDLLFNLQSEIVFPIFAGVALVTVMRCPKLSLDTLVLGSRKAHWWLYWKTAILPLHFLSIWIGSNFGLIGVVIASFILQMVLFFGSYVWLVNSLTRLPFGQYLAIFIRPLLLAGIVVPIIMLLLPFFSSPLLSIIVGILLYSLSYLGLIRLLNPSLFILARSFFTASK